jgi:hypothetical protein
MKLEIFSLDEQFITRRYHGRIITLSTSNFNHPKGGNHSPIQVGKEGYVLIFTNKQEGA